MPVQTPSDKRRQSVDVTGNKTLVAADQGIVQNVITDAVTITLPAAGAAATGLKFVIRNGGAKAANGAYGTGASGSVGFTVTTSGTDTVAGNGFTAAANKGPVNTKATSTVGDEVSLCSGVNSYNVVEVIGTFARQA